MKVDAYDQPWSHVAVLYRIKNGKNLPTVSWFGFFSIIWQQILMGSITKIKSFSHVSNSDPADKYKIQPENFKKPKNKHEKLLAIHVLFKQLAVQNIEYIMTHTGDLQCGMVVWHQMLQRTNTGSRPLLKIGADNWKQIPSNSWNDFKPVIIVTEAELKSKLSFGKTLQLQGLWTLFVETHNNCFS